MLASARMSWNLKTVGRVRWWVEGTPPRTLQKLMQDPDAVLQGPGSVARGPAGRKHFYRLESETGHPAILVKIFNIQGWASRARYWMRPSKARHEAEIARALVSRGFDVSVPIAVGEERRWGVLARSFSIIPELRARDLLAILRDPETTDAERRAIAENFGSFARKLHDAGINQDDFSPNNFLLDDKGRYVLIDFERCEVGSPLGERRWTLIAKLHRHKMRLTYSNRLRFLRAYLGENTTSQELRDAWTKIEPIFYALRRRDARRAGEGAFEAGRNIHHDGDMWTVHARRDEPVKRIMFENNDAACTAWRRSHQIERLALPALKGVRMGPDWVEYQRPDIDGEPNPIEIERNLKRCKRFGEFVSEPQWGVLGGLTVLTNPHGYQPNTDEDDV